MNWCRLHRWFVSSRLDDGGAMPARVRRHLQDCPACRAHFERERRCAEALAAQAEGVRVPAPPFLRQRVLANVASWDGDPATPPRPGPWALAASVAAVVIAFWLVVGPRPESGSEARRAAVPQAAMAALERIPSGVTVLEFGAQLDVPLQNEWESVVLDARNAFAALSRSFLPGEFDANH